MLFKPEDLRGSEPGGDAVPDLLDRGGESAEAGDEFFTLGDRARIAPEFRRANYFVPLIERDEPMLLARNPDAAHRDTVIAHLKQVITAAGRMGVGLVNTFCGGDASKSVDDNWKAAEQLWPAIVAHARDSGVKLTFENCPMIFSKDEWPGGHNIAYSPRIWRRILEAWNGEVGINFDPSHLVWQMIDQARFIREFDRQAGRR